MDRPSEQAPGATASSSVAKPDGEIPSGELQVIEHVKEDLLKSGIRKDQAPIVATKVVRTVESYHSGPLPSVREFAGYEEICPGAARDILDMAIRDQEHEHRMDSGRLYGGIFLKVCGMISVLAVLGMMIGGAIYAAQIGHENLGIAIASGTGLALVTGVVARIILGRDASKEKPKAPAKPPSKRKKN